MKVKVKHYRTAAFHTDDIRRCVGLQEGKPAEIMAKLKELYGPIAPRIQIFWNIIPDEGMAEGDPTMAYVGIEAMVFDVQFAGLPVAGLVREDPLRAEELQRADGALQGELERWGLWKEADDFEWRCMYEVKP